MSNMYQQWADAFRSIGEWHISGNKCCKILAIIYDNAGNESFTLSQRFVTDWKTAQQRLHILGGEEIPADRLEDVAELRETLKGYIREIEQSHVSGKSLKETLPQWAKDIYDEYSLPIMG